MRLLTILLPLALCVACSNDHMSDVHASAKSASASRDSSAMKMNEKNIEKNIDKSETVARDNSAVNVRDRSSTAVTPIDQSNAAPDLELLAKVRQALVDDASLSISAKNVKVMTHDGQVVLRGTVPTIDERMRIESLARACAGTLGVDNQIETTDK